VRPEPHVCFVAPQAWPVLSRDPDIDVIGGAEVQQSILARGLAAAGYRVSMICLDFGQPQHAQVDGVTVHKTYRPDEGIPVLRFLYPRLTGIWHAMRKVDADVYYQRTTAMLTGVVAEFCRRHGKRSIYGAASNVDFLPGRQRIRYLRDRRLYEHGLRRVDQVIVQNAEQQRNCRVHYGREAMVIPSCYELPAGAGRSGGDAVLWVGNMSEIKRPELFLQIARRLPHRRFIMVGGSGRNGAAARFESIRAAATQHPNLEFFGFLPLERVEPLFDRARVVLNTSIYEGMPNTFLQAWARGVPTLSFAPIEARLAGDPVNRVATSVEDASAAIERLLDDGAHWQRASARCREYFDRTHATSPVLERFGRVIDELHHAAKAA
jgi:glycosyltransferase involved in cell wall biosynthesis